VANIAVVIDIKVNDVRTGPGLNLPGIVLIICFDPLMGLENISREKKFEEKPKKISLKRKPEKILKKSKTIKGK